jgi:hypothetical protein
MTFCPYISPVMNISMFVLWLKLLLISIKAAPKNDLSFIYLNFESFYD